MGETRYNADGSVSVYIRYLFDGTGTIVGIGLWDPADTAWTDYYFVKNLQGDVLQVYRESDNALAASYTYDSWGNVLTASGPLAKINPFRYRGYYYDTETWFYYLQSRYYDPAIGRFINADAYTTTGQGIVGHNMFAYCGNNPVVRQDSAGRVWETVFDVASLGASIVEVAANPADPWAWAGLVGDAIDLVPFVTGVGEVARAVKATSRLVDNGDNVIDAAKAMRKAADANSNLRRATGVYEITYASGKNYVGKGGFSRAIKSAVQHAKPNKYNDYIGDTVTALKWKYAPNRTTAFIEEYALQTINQLKKTHTYNLIWSPGRRLFLK